MPFTRQKKVVASRRRREDEGEEEGSVAGDLEDDSLSEGSVISNGDDDADVEASDISEDETAKTPCPGPAVGQPESTLPTERHNKGPSPQTTDSEFVTSSDTKAMMNGLKLGDGKNVPEVDFDGPTADATDSRPRSNISRETPAERSRREHLEYLKQRNENPAFVPNRGGFFLHDNRAAHSGPNGFRESPRGRGRGSSSGFQPSRVPPFAEPTDQPWAHDLHDSVSTATTRNSTATQTLLNAASAKVPTALQPSSQAAPTRSFSTSVLLGKVPVIIHLPGMQERRTVQNVAKKKHTLLPQHRPPLRRDKPVRIFLPNQQPRYIFPSTERSFIFIPRALRPNQQGFGRGRGRSSFNASRRTSVYGGSTHTPSVAMSRRSSLGAVLPADGVRSPGGSALALPVPPNYVAESGKPVVRFPPAAQPLGVLASPGANHVQATPNVAVQVQPAILPNRGRQENVPDALTMHQPQPQKTVSVVDIESPGTFHINPPAQQQEQPFHQQMPVPVNHQVYAGDGTGHNIRAGRVSHISQPGGTPLSQIPERAIYAQPFQPFPVPSHAPGYLPAAYTPGAVFYPVTQGDMPGYGAGVMPPSLPPPPYLASVHPPPYMVPAAAQPARSPADGNVPAGTVAHETNGMVYYFDSAQLTPTSSAPYSAPFAGGTVGGMITPPHHFFYPAAHNGVYYAAP